MEALRQQRVVRHLTPAARIMLGLAMGGAVYLCFLVVKPFAAPLLLGTALAVFCFPLHRRIRRHLKNRTGAAALSTALILIAIILPATALGFAVAREFNQARAAFATDGSGTAALWALLRPVLALVSGWAGVTETQLQENIRVQILEASKSLLGQSVAWIGALVGGVLKSFIALIALFFVLRDGDRLHRRIVAWSPLGFGRTEALLLAVHRSVVASFYGLFAVAAAQGVMCGVGVWLAGLNSPLLWGIAAGAASLVPLVGTSLVWVPASLLLFASGATWSGVFMLAWGAGLVGLIDNVVRPLVVTARVPVHPLLMLVAMLGGLGAFGIAGVFIGPATLALTAALLRIVREEMRS